MATPKGQRIGIWIIVIVMAVGTIGTYFAIVLGNTNDKQQAAEQQKLIESYYQQIRDNARANNQVLAGYQVSTYDSAAVTELKIEDLVAGEGAEVKAGDKIKVSYSGWTPDGLIFDTTTKTGTNTPAEFTLDRNNLISGWIDGIPGMKVGGTRQLTIPAAQAYGAEGSEPLIPANTPLRFIIRLESIVT